MGHYSSFTGSQTIEFEGTTYTLEYAEVWLLDLDETDGLLNGEHVKARVVMEYSTDLGGTVKIDRYGEGFRRRADEGFIRPESATQIVEMDGRRATIEKFFSNVTTNDGYPDQEKIARLIAEAQQAEWADDPLALDDDNIP